MMAKTRATWSKSLLWLSAALTPNQMPNAMTGIMAQSASSSVAGIRRMSTSMTGSRPLRE